MAFVKPTVGDFKTYFFRDFPYNLDPNLGVTDLDITKAMGEADMIINDQLVGTQEDYNKIYLLLTAHYLVMDLRMAGQGINGNYSWITSSKSVGSVSEGYAIPNIFLDNPLLSMLAKTNYGAKYLNLIYTNFIGSMFTVGGRTHA